MNSFGFSSEASHEVNLDGIQRGRIHPTDKKQQGYQCDSRQQFSFSRQFKRPGDSFIKQKYHELYTDLKQMDPEDIMELLLEQIQENEQAKVLLQSDKNRINTLEEQLKGNRQLLKKKGQAIALLCQTQSKNLQLVEKLEVKLSKRSEHYKDTYYEKKYQQLSIYMNQYIRNINQAQEEFKRAYGNLKNQNQRLKNQSERNHEEIIKSSKRYQVQNQQLKRFQYQMRQICQKNKTGQHNLMLIKEQNQILRKQIEVYQQNIRITDRLQAHFCQENQQLSSQLDFIKQKISENHNVSKDIVQRFEENSMNCQKIMKAKQLMCQSFTKEKERCGQLEKQILILRKRNDVLQSERQNLQREYSRIIQQKEEIQSEYLEEKAQKQGIKKELICLADKVRLMESTYKKQIEQSQQIKGELCKFWEKKQRSQKYQQSLSLHSNSPPNPNKNSNIDEQKVLNEIQLNQSAINSQETYEYYCGAEFNKSHSTNRTVHTQYTNYGNKSSKCSYRKHSNDLEGISIINKENEDSSMIELGSNTIPKKTKH